MEIRRGIIFVHGIVGNNRIFDVLRPIVPEDCEVKCVALKGHGGDALAFSRASMAQWLEQVGEAIAQLSRRCDSIVGIGHSMGCLLLMEQAARSGLSGLFLLNPPLRLSIRLSLLRNVFKVAAGRIEDDPVAQAAKDAYGVSIDFNLLHYYGWPRRYVELFREISHVRKTMLPQIECPMVAMLSAKDEMVSLTSAKELENKPNASTVILPTSYHYFYSTEDRERIRSAFTNWFGI